MSLLSCLPPSFLAISVYIVFVLCANLVVQVENKSYFGIGARIVGDQLLLKDVLRTPPISLTEEPVIKFQYAIEEPITYIEIESDEIVHAKVNFSYELSLVEGIISSINSEQYARTGKPEPFAVHIRIYGFNDTMLNVNPASILNKDQEFNGILQPIYQQNINQSKSLIEEDLKALDDLDYDDDEGDEEDIVYEEDDFNNNYDKIIEQGQRQEGDFLVYESNQTSATTTKIPLNHSVTFYYVDIYHITYVKFTIYEHYLFHFLDDDDTYVVEYAHISPTTLKAIVTDRSTTSVFVQMQMYGFHPNALPVDYKPFLSNSQISEKTGRVSSLKQLKILMNAQQSTTKEEQQQNYTKPMELGHQISSDNQANVNCMQQVLSPNGGHRMSAHWPIFNSIATILVTVIMIFI